MRTPACFTEVQKYWNTETVLSKGLILTTLLLLVMAYLPTLQFDYVTQDQWRAFRYSTLEQTPYEHAKARVETTWKFYVQTGRPLVWMTECVEHSAVAKISDFVYLRPIALSIVLVSAVYLGAVLATRALAVTGNFSQMTGHPVGMPLSLATRITFRASQRMDQTGKNVMVRNVKSSLLMEKSLIELLRKKVRHSRIKILPIGIGRL